MYLNSDLVKSCKGLILLTSNIRNKLMTKMLYHYMYSIGQKKDTPEALKTMKCYLFDNNNTISLISSYSSECQVKNKIKDSYKILFCLSIQKY